MWQLLSDGFDRLQQALFERVFEPLMYRIGLGGYLEDAYGATGWLLAGAIQIVVMVTLIAALERWRPVEPVRDRRSVRTDILYTLVHRLGLFRLALFFTVDPLWDWLAGGLRLHGLAGVQLDQLWPGVTDLAPVSFALYLVLFDFAGYWIHRGQHGLRWWWQLHALHHSQRQMTMWSDNRNHLLDDLVVDSLLVLLAMAVGIAPGQFVAVVACTQLLQSLAHANLRLSFGPLERVLVSPRFHRRHHGIGVGHESGGRGTLGGCNFAVLFPVWDLVFRTADWSGGYDATGIRDQLPQEGGRDYGRGFWSQQWLGLKRLAGRA